jgi:hypothetical protein
VQETVGAGGQKRASWMWIRTAATRRKRCWLCAAKPSASSRIVCERGEARGKCNLRRGTDWAAQSQARRGTDRERGRITVQYGRRDETCLVSTEGGTRRVQLVREGEGRGGVGTSRVTVLRSSARRQSDTCCEASVTPACAAPRRT